MTDGLRSTTRGIFPPLPDDSWSSLVACWSIIVLLSLSPSFTHPAVRSSTSGLVSAQCYNGTPYQTLTVGLQCSSCLPSWSGPHCNISCRCTLGVCDAGINGDGSCTGCWQPFYGPTCSTRCSCMFGTCDNRTTSTGVCTTCVNNWLTGANCDGCVAGRGGTICQVQCPSTCGNGQCDAGRGKSGKCICNAGWFGGHCDRQKITRTVSMSLVPRTTPRPPVPPPSPQLTTAPRNTSNASLTPAPPNSTTAAPPLRLIYSISLKFIRPPDLDNLTATIASLTAFSPASDIDLSYSSTDALVVLVQFNGTRAQSGYQTLLNLLVSGSNDLGRLGLAQYSVLYADQITTAIPTSPPPTTLPPVTLPPAKDTLPPGAVAGIAIGVIILLILIAALIWWNYVKRERKREERHKAAMAEKKLRYHTNENETFHAGRGRDERGSRGSEDQDAGAGGRRRPTGDRQLPTALVPEEEEFPTTEFSHLPRDLLEVDVPPTKQKPSARDDVDSLDDEPRPTAAAPKGKPPVASKTAVPTPSGAGSSPEESSSFASPPPNTNRRGTLPGSDEGYVVSPMTPEAVTQTASKPAAGGAVGRGRARPVVEDDEVPGMYSDQEMEEAAPPADPLYTPPPLSLTPTNHPPDAQLESAPRPTEEAKKKKVLRRKGDASPRGDAGKVQRPQPKKFQVRDVLSSDDDALSEPTPDRAPPNPNAA